ncbi:MAG: hypothetical protein QXK34_03230, partial [Candidatus Bathyarchaeia archaeon]
QCAASPGLARVVGDIATVRSELRVVGMIDEAVRVGDFTAALRNYDAVPSEGSPHLAASILFLLAISIAHSIALDPGGIERIVPLTPLMALSVPSAFPEFRGRAARRGALTLALVLLLLVPLSTQGLIGPKKAYIIMPEYRTALELRKRYSGGAVLCDSPTIIYYSGIDPKAFLSFDHLASSGAMRDPKSIADWLRTNGVGYLIWQNASFSKSWILFPDLGVAGDRWIESVRLVPAYEDSIRSYRGSGPGKGNYTQWEHVYPGVHDLVMYKVEFS